MGESTIDVADVDLLRLVDEETVVEVEERSTPARGEKLGRPRDRSRSSARYRVYGMSVSQGIMQQVV